MPPDWAEFEPPDRVSPQRDAPLMAFLQAHRQRPVRISLRQQRRPDTRILQILLTASRSWQLQGLRFDVTGLSASLAKDLVRLGFSAENTGWSGLP